MKITYAKADGTNVEVEASAEYIAQREAEIARATERKTAEANEETAKATAQANGNTKLLDLGLTQAEATALTGYTPPVEDEE
jgi:hypothetical protein